MDDKRRLTRGRWTGAMLAGFALLQAPGAAEAACATPTVLWTRTLNGPSNSTDLVARVATDTLGNVIVAGHETNGALNWVTRKYDASGNLLWQQGFAGAAGGTDEVYDVDTDPSNNVIVGGTEAVTGQSYNWRIRKYDPSGALLWTWTYNGAPNNDDRLYGVAVDPSGNVFGVGFETRSDLGQAQNFLIVKLDANGAFQWQRTYTSPGAANDFAWDADADSAGNVIVGVSDVVSGQYDWQILRYSPTGVTTWIGAYAGAGGVHDEAWGVAVDGLDGFAVAGQTALGGVASLLVRKYDAAGTLQWSRTYSSPSGSTAVAFTCAADAIGNIVAAGFDNRPDLGQAMNWLAIRYDAAGNVCWSWTENASAPLGSNDFVRGAAFDPSGNVVLAGARAVSGQGDNWLIRKLGTAAPPTDSYRLVVPAMVYAGVPFWLTVVAIDATGATKTDYCGTSTFTSTDPGAKIEGTNMDAYNFTWSSSLACSAAPNENGVKQFINVTFPTPCVQTLMVWDTVGVTSFFASATIPVRNVPLTTALTTVPASPTAGQPFLAVLAVTNPGTLAVNTTTAGLWKSSGTASLAAPGPSAPAIPTMVTAASTLSFTWTVTALTTGTLCLSASASGLECSAIPISSTALWCGSVTAGAGGPPLAWTFSITRAGNDDVFHSAADSCNNQIAVGWESPSGVSKFTVRKTAPDGTPIWTLTATGPGGTMADALSVAIDANDAILVSGRQAPGGQGLNWLLCKISPSGSFLWTTTYNSPANADDEPWGVAAAANGDMIVAGHALRSDLGQGYDWRVTRHAAADGALLWVTTYHGSVAGGTESSNGVAVDAAGNILVTGFEANPAGGSRWRIVKYTGAGTVIWSRSYAGRAGSIDGKPTDLVLDPSGDLYVSGMDLVTAWPDYDWMVRRIDGTNGDVIWERIYVGAAANNDEARAITRLPDGTVVATGVHTVAGQGRNALARAWDANGTFLWSVSYNGPVNGDDEYNGASADRCGNVAFTGGHTTAAGGMDWLVQKYSFGPDCGCATPPSDHYRIVLPPAVYAGVPFWLTVVAVDGTGATKTDYCGTSSFTSTDPDALIEGTAMDAYDFPWSSSLACPAAPDEDGVRRFVNVVFPAACSRILSVTDTVGGTSFTGSVTVFVQSATLGGALALVPPVPVAGQPFLAVWTVNNTSPATLPGLTATLWKSSGGAPAVWSDAASPASYGAFPGGSTAVFTWTVTGLSAGSLCLTVTATGPGCGSAVVTATSWCGAVVDLGPVLTVQKTQTPASPVPGAAVTWAIHVRNAGIETVTALTVVDTVSAVVAVGGTDQPGGFPPPVVTGGASATRFEWTAGALALAPGRTMTFTITGGVGEVCAPTPVPNRALVIGTNAYGSTVMSSNQTSFTALPATIAAFMSQTQVPAAPYAGDPVVWRLVVANTGSATIVSVQVVDTIAPVLTAIAIDGPGWLPVPAVTPVASGTRYEWLATGLALAPGQSFTITITGVLGACPGAATLAVSNSPWVAVASACGGAGLAGLTNPVGFSYACEDVPPGTTPGVAVNLTGTLGVITWDPATRGGWAVSAYLVWRDTCAACGPVQIATLPDTASVFSDSVPEACTLFCYSIQAQDTAGNTGTAGTACVMTPCPPVPALTTVLQLLTPSPVKGGPVVYRLIVANTGGVTSVAVSVADSLPVGIIGVTTAAPAWLGAPLTYAASTGATTWAWYAAATFAPGQVLTITITGTVDPSTTLTSLCNRFDATMSWMGGVQTSNTVCFAVTSAPPPPPPPPVDDGLKDGVKIVGGIRGYIEPRRGEMANILVRPTGSGVISVRIYNLRGDLVRTLTASAAGGRTEVLHWDANDDAGRPVPAGVYPVFIEAPGIRYTDKLAVLR